MSMEYAKDIKLLKLQYAKEYIKQQNYCQLDSILANEFDDNYLGECTLTFGKQKAEVESIWTDVNKCINIHIDSPYYEGDILLNSISKSNQMKIVDMLRKRVERE